MGLVDIYIRFSNKNVVLDKVTTLNMEEKLVYQDESNDFKTHQKTTIKFSILTIASPLIAIARLVRSVAFAIAGHFHRASREFIGGLAAPLITSYCLIGSLLSSALYVISAGNISFYVQMRRTYAYFEAWTNQIHLQRPDLVSYSQRVSSPLDYIGNSKGIHKFVWTTAPCMQPILEKGDSNAGGILDAARMRKIFPLININNVYKENGKIVIQSEYSNKDERYSACGGAYEHARMSSTCCCYRIEAVYDRFLCCEVGKGNCSSIANSGDSCGVSFCNTCGVWGCCCYEQENNELTQINGCFGIQGLGLLAIAMARQS